MKYSENEEKSNTEIRANKLKERFCDYRVRDDPWLSNNFIIKCFGSKKWNKLR